MHFESTGKLNSKVNYNVLRKTSVLRVLPHERNPGENMVSAHSKKTGIYNRENCFAYILWGYVLRGQIRMHLVVHISHNWKRRGEIV